MSTAAVSQTGVTPLAPDFGPNVLIFDPSMPTSQIRATVDAIATQQVPNQFGTQRYALLFKPGIYGSAADPLDFQVGYYTEVAGLGASPSSWRETTKMSVSTVETRRSCRITGSFVEPARNVRIADHTETIRNMVDPHVKRLTIVLRVSD